MDVEVTNLSRYYHDANKYCPLDEEQLRVLFVRLRAGDKSVRDKIILTNLRLVVEIAGRYRNRRGELSFEDLVAQGNIGLIVAVDKFDPSRIYVDSETNKTKNIKFSSFAGDWIEHYIGRFLEKYNLPVHIPLNTQVHTFKVKYFIKEFLRANGRKPTWPEIQEKFNFKPNDAGHVQDQLYLSFSQLDHSIKISDDVSVNYKRQLSDKNQISPLEIMRARRRLGYLIEVQKKILQYSKHQAKPTEKILLQKHYSIIKLNDEEKRPGIDVLAAKMKISRETLYEAGRNMIRVLARRFKLPSSEVINLEEKIIEGKIFFLDYLGEIIS